MSNSDRLGFLEKQLLTAESKALGARSEETRRAWTIIAREWRKMIEGEKLKFVAPSESNLIPENVAVDLESAIKSLTAAIRS